MQIKDRNYSRDSSEYYTTYKNAIRYHATCLYKIQRFVKRFSVQNN